mmetsp:Transcript_37119/g.116790  ORF Transcript_37119/g.116790 Transcript_37119/m.116790 type:complete len:358 (-) Transcript_37119:597-1670(-)
MPPRESKPPRTCFNCGAVTHQASDCGAEPSEAGRTAWAQYRSYASRKPATPAARDYRLVVARNVAAAPPPEGPLCHDPVAVMAARGTERAVHDVVSASRATFHNIMVQVKSSLARATCHGAAVHAGAGDALKRSLNQAVRDGAPADFSDPDAIVCYANDRVAPRCRYLYNLLMDPAELCGGVRRMLLPGREAVPAGGGELRRCEVVSIGGGPGFDHLTLLSLATFLREVQPPPPPGLDYAEVAVTTSVYDLFAPDWEPVVGALDSACRAAGLLGEMSNDACDVRERLSHESNDRLRAQAGTADLFIFSFVLHENATSLTTEGGGLSEGCLLPGLLEAAKPGAYIVCTDSGARSSGLL